MTTEQRCPVCGVDEKYATDGSCAKCYPPSRRMTTEQGAPEAGAWKTVPRKPTPVQLEQAASNLADEFGVDFVLANEQFALAVYDEMLAASPSPPPVGVGDDDVARAIAAYDILYEASFDIGDIFLIDNKPVAMRAALEAFIAGGDFCVRSAEVMSAPPVGGEVVKLTWRGDFAHTDFGLFYYVNHATGQPGCVVLEKHEGASTLKSAWVTVDDAKAAAQADFERRIRSALVPSSPSLLKDATDALEWAKGFVDQHYEPADDHDFKVKTAIDAALAKLGVSS